MATIIGTPLNNVLNGTAGDDDILGLAGNDTLNGGAGNDLLDGGLGIDSMTGGSGDDTYVVDSLFDVVVETGGIGSGDDTIESFINILGLAAEVENLVLLGTAATGIGNALGNLIVGTGLVNTLDGKAGADTLIGGLSSDNYIVDNAGDVVIEFFGEGTDTVTASVDFDLADNLENLVFSGAGNIGGRGNQLNNQITGNAGANFLRGEAGLDTLTGAAGDDTLDGGTGNDMMIGGDGNDVYILDSGGDRVSETNALPAGGIDRVEASRSYTLEANVENLVLTGSGGLVGDIGTGNALANQITGTPGGDFLSGLGGNDTLDGGAGDDQLIGGASADSLVGGVGVDAVDYGSSTAAVTVNLATGVGTGGDAAGDVYSGVENAGGGSSHDSLLGDANANRLGGAVGNDTLIGADGSDILDGGSGNDSMRGGAGDDQYLVDAAGDIVWELNGSGIDTVFSSITYRLTGGVENLFIHSSAIGGTGNRLANTITGNFVNNVLSGLDGNDSLYGFEGDDILDGGDGDDVLQGHAGADRLYGRAGNDTVDYSESFAVIVFLDLHFAAEGTAQGDTFSGIENIVGSGFGDLLRGDSGANRIQAGAGDDSVTGDAGADILDGGFGNDQLQYFRSAAGVSVDLEFNIVSGGDAAGDVISGFEHVVGSDFDDVLRGTAGANRFDGRSGADTVTYAGSSAGINVNLATNTFSGGHAEGDTLVSIENIVGSAFDDVFVGNASANRLDGANGIDTVTYAGAAAGVSVAVGGAVGAGAAAGDTLFSIERLIGSAFDDTLTGSLEDQTLIGGAGADVLDGGTGTDVADYSASAAAVFVEFGGQTSGGDADGDSLTGFENIFGSAFNDRLTGDAGVNLFEGGAGNDTLVGLGGGDALLGGDGRDTADFSTAGAAVMFSLAFGGFGGDANGDFFSSMENAIGSSFADDILGNEEANLLQGGAGNDTLESAPGVGQDTLEGGSGDDEYHVLSSNDVVIEALGQGSDMVRASVDYDLSAAIGVERLVLFGGATSGTGNALDNSITGTSSSNTLAGGAGSDTLAGLAGADRLDGGADGDTADYSASAVGVTVNLETGAGTGGDADGDTLIGIEHLTGSSSDDRFIASAAPNSFSGGAGTDTVDYSLSSAAVTASLVLAQGAGGHASGDALFAIEALWGSAFGDWLQGDGGMNTLAGGAGDDTLLGGAQPDLLNGGTGEDTADYSNSPADVSIDLATGLVSGGDAAGDALIDVEHLVGSAGQDQLNGNAAANRLVGGSGFDTIEGFEGADTLVGGADIDTLSYALSNAGVTVNLAASTASGGHAAGDVISGFENLTGSQWADRLTGTAASNALVGAGGDDTLAGLDGADAIDGGSGSDTADYSASSAAVTVNLAGLGFGTGIGGDAHGDLLLGIENVVGSAFSDNLTGGLGSNVLQGGSGNDALVGGAGADVLDGGAGSDTASYLASVAAVRVDLWLGAGFTGDATGDLLVDIEHLIGSSADDTLTGSSAANNLNGGAGNDRVDYGFSSAAVFVDLAAKTAAGGHAAGDDLTSIEELEGSLFSDRLTGDSGANALVGDAGDDTLIGAGGADFLLGGLGLDTADYSTSGSAIDVKLVAGTGLGGDAQGDVLASIENVIGSSNGDGLSGSDGDNSLWGGSGNDVIHGRDGADRLDGQGGDDTLEGGADADELVGGSGNDWASYASSADGVAVDLASGSGSSGDADGDQLNSIENLIGSSHDDMLSGNVGRNLLEGGDGNDTLFGAGGDDTLLGGLGADEINGGAGTDRTSYANAVVLDLLTGGGSPDGAGDTFIDVEIIAGSPFDDQLFGDAADNHFDGLDGNDTLEGRGGFDMLIGGDGDDSFDYVEADMLGDLVLGGIGDTDAMRIFDGGTAIDFHFGNKFELEALQVVSGAWAVFLGANSLNAGIELVDASGNTEAVMLDASARSDGVTMLGGQATDVLVAGSGNDSLAGAAGDDVLTGGAGADSLDGGTGLDRASYAASTAGVSVNLSTGTGVLGHAAGDTLVGIEVLEGSDFRDTLIGSTGDDTLYGALGNDTLSDLDGNDWVDGGAGNDTFSAGAGDDTLVGDTGNDQFVFTSALLSSADVIDGGIGTDELRIQGGAALDDDDFTQASNLETINIVNVPLPGAAHVVNLGFESEDAGVGVVTAITLDANNSLTADASARSIGIIINSGNGNDVLVGGAGNDNLTGSGGHDLLIGGADNDTLGGGSGNDTLSAGTGDDFVAGVGGVNHYIFPNLDFDANDVVLGGGSADTLELQGGGTLDDAQLAAVQAVGTLRFTGGAGNNVTLGLVSQDAGIVTVDAQSGFGLDLNASARFVALTVVSGNGNDTITGSGGSDSIEGALGSDSIYGGFGQDELSGQDGDDTLQGGLGNDILIGGGGNDAFVFDALIIGEADTVIDFSAVPENVDEVYLDDAVFINIGPVGPLDAAAFLSGAGVTEAQDLDQRIVYDTDTGDMYYDDDGAGGVAAERFATFQGAPAIDHTDIFVF